MSFITKTKAIMKALQGLENFYKVQGSLLLFQVFFSLEREMRQENEQSSGLELRC